MIDEELNHLPEHKKSMEPVPIDEITYWKTILQGEYMGIDFESMKAYVGNHTWALQPNAHTKSSIDIISETLRYHKEVLDNYKKGKATEEELLKSTNTVVKTNLENCLIDFSYEEAAESEDIGPKVLADLSGMLKDFLMYVGGRPGVKRLLQQSKATKIIGSHISLNSQKN